MTTEKTCFKCSRSLPRSSFYKHPRMADGLFGKCKDCTKKDVSDHRLKNIDRIRSYDIERSKSNVRREAAKAYKQTEAGKEVQYRASKKCKESKPERAKARGAVARALRRGILRREPCFVCGEFAEAHHPDYSSPLSVTWLCKKHHTEVHELAKELNAKHSNKPF